MHIMNIAFENMLDETPIFIFSGAEILVGSAIDAFKRTGTPVRTVSPRELINGFIESPVS